MVIRHRLVWSSCPEVEVLREVPARRDAIRETDLRIPRPSEAGSVGGRRACGRDPGRGRVVREPTLHAKRAGWVPSVRARCRGRLQRARGSSGPERSRHSSPPGGAGPASLGLRGGGAWGPTCPGARCARRGPARPSGSGPLVGAQPDLRHDPVENDKVQQGVPERIQEEPAEVERVFPAVTRRTESGWRLAGRWR